LEESELILDNRINPSNNLFEYSNNNINQNLNNKMIMNSIFDFDKNIKMIRYFKLSNNDASYLTWAHAVNNKKLLDESLQNSDIKFIEADILFIEEKHTQPIMAHPPLVDSDLTFSEWLNKTKTSGKGLKLDFKSANSILPCLSMLNSLGDQVYYIFINEKFFKFININDF
jgi:hypothetical protein